MHFYGEALLWISGSTKEPRKVGSTGALTCALAAVKPIVVQSTIERGRSHLQWAPSWRTADPLKGSDTTIRAHGRAPENFRGRHFRVDAYMVTEDA